MLEDRDPLRYTDRKDWIIQEARKLGLSDEQIILKLTVGRQYPDVKQAAKDWSLFLGKSYGEFMKLARRGPGRR